MQYWRCIFAVFMAISVGTSSLIARRIGANDFEAAKVVARQATWVSIGLGIVFGIITWFFSEPLLKVMGAAPNVLEVAVSYFKIVGMSSIFIALMFTFGSILRATGDTKTPMNVSLWMNILHIGLDYVLIFGIGSFVGLGVEGAAWATVLVRILGSIRLYQHIQKSEVAFNLFKAAIPEQKKWTLELVKTSLPTAAERLFMRLGQVLYFGLIVRIGTETYAAHTIAGNIDTFAYMPGYGLAIAATTLVGQSFGANKLKDAYVYGWLTTAVGVVVMSSLGVVLFFTAPWLATLFTTEASTVEMVVTALRISAVSQPALAVTLILAGALQGMGDTKSPMYSTAVGMWVIRVVGVYVLGIEMGLGIAGVWLSIGIDMAIRALFLAWMFRRHFKQ